MGTGERYVGVLAMGMAALIFCGFFVFISGWGNTPGQEPGRAKALFVVANAVTLTGFELTTNVGDYKVLGQATIFALILGGAFFSLGVGGWALTRILNMPYTDLQVVRATLFEFLLVLLGAAILMSLRRMDWWPALFQTTSALANAGHTLGPAPAYADRLTHLILLPLAILGGLGVPVLLDISSSIKLNHKLHSHSRTVLVLTAAMYIVGLLVITGIEWTASDEFQQLLTSRPAVENDPADKGDQDKAMLPVLRKSLAIASTESLNNRTLGFPLGSFQLLSPASQWFVVLLMLIGGSPGSTAGGIKNTTALVLVRDSWSLWCGRPVNRLFGLAGLWTMAYLLAILVVVILLAIAQPQLPGDRMVFMAVSAVTNTGTSHAPLSMTPMALDTLSAAMLFGRFVPLMILWHAASDTMQGR